MPGHCVSGHGQTATVESGTSLVRCNESITVDGTLVVENDTYIATRRIHVTPHGSVQIGTRESPASNVTIYLDHDDCEGLLYEGNRDSWDATANACLDEGEIRVEGVWQSHGVPRTAWTLLTADCVNTGPSTHDGHACPPVLHSGTIGADWRGCGCDQLQVEECHGWAPGDRVVVAHNLHRTPADGATPESTVHTIATVAAGGGANGSCLVELVTPTYLPRIGDNPHKTFNNTLGDTIKLRAEVMHLERTIHITGPMHPRNASDPGFGGQGIVTRAGGSGEVVMSWHRMSNCGRVLLGKYCHHFHHRHEAGGEITGAVIERSVSKGVTIHGTSNVLVRSTNIWNHRGAGIYLENGAEHNNTLMGNAIGCATPSCPEGRPGCPVGRCSLRGGVGSQSDADHGEQSGIYSLSMAGANLIGNHVFMMDNAFFANQAPIGAWGKDVAANRVVPKAMPLPRFEYNVFHDNSGFGWYANIHAPLQVEIDAMGYVTDWGRTCAFNTTTGADQGAPGYVSHHIEYHNDFSMGAYDLGDTSAYNMTTVDGVKAQYWKTYRRSLASGPIMDECVVRAAVEAPGGQGLVEYRNVTWETGHIRLNHHCALGTGEVTGGVCASCYFVNGGTGASRDTMTLEDEVTRENPNRGYVSSLVLEHGPLDATFFLPTGYPIFAPESIAGCNQTAMDITDFSGTYWWRCRSAMKIRPLVIFSPDRGTLTVRDAAPGHSVGDGASSSFQVPHRNTNIGPGAGVGYMYAPAGKTWAVGYTMLVRDGAELEITIPDDVRPADTDWADYFVMQYSEANWPASHRSSINVTVVGTANATRYGLAGGPFIIHSNHSRAWLLPFGGMISASGAWYDAKRAAGEAATWENVTGFLDAAEYETLRASYLGDYVSPSPPPPPPSPPSRSPPSPPPPVPASGTTCATNVDATSAFAVTVANQVYYLDGTVASHRIGARTYHFSGIPDTHPMKLWQDDGACTVTLASCTRSVGDDYCVGDGSWTVPSACAGSALSLSCSRHGPMGGTDRFTFDSSCSSRRRRLEQVPNRCDALQRVDDCRFDGWSTPKLHLGETRDEAYAACCASCREACVAFSLESTETTLRANNRTQRVAHSCVLLDEGEDPAAWRRREMRVVQGGARVTTSRARCYVPPAPPPPPPEPPPLRVWAPVMQPPPLPTPPSLPELPAPTRTAEPPPEPAVAADGSDWWFQMADLEDDHAAPWRNRAPVPKHRWRATSDPSDRL